MASPPEAHERWQEAMGVIATFEAARELDSTHPGALASVLEQAEPADRALIDGYLALRNTMYGMMERALDTGRG